MGNSHDLDGLIRFILRDEVWSGRMANVLGEHVGPALEEFDLDFADLGEILGDSWPMVLWGGAFEDLLGRGFGRGAETVVDIYLKHHGSQEAALTRAYIEGLKDAPVSLYEVSEIVPGKSMRLRDLLTGAGPVTVREKSATRSLRPWDRIAVRVVPEGKGFVISGALLPFPHEAVEFLFDGLRDAMRINGSSDLRLSTKQLRRCAPIFANAWLFSCLLEVLDPEPLHLANSEGDELLFHDIRFPLAVGVVQKDVATRLDGVEAFEPTEPKVWTWLELETDPTRKAGKGLAVASEISAATILGTIELKGKSLTLSVNSARRAERGTALLRETLGDLVKSPLTAIQTIEQKTAEPPRDAPEEELPPEISRQLSNEFLDRHYRETLDQPVPALDGKTPRDASRDPAAREQVIAWLKLIENRSASQVGSPVAEYDFRWMWEELGLSEHRR